MSSGVDIEDESRYQNTHFSVEFSFYEGVFKYLFPLLYLYGDVKNMLLALCLNTAVLLQCLFRKALGTLSAL